MMINTRYYHYHYLNNFRIDISFGIIRGTNRMEWWMIIRFYSFHHLLFLFISFDFIARRFHSISSFLSYIASSNVCWWWIEWKDVCWTMWCIACKVHSIVHIARLIDWVILFIWRHCSIIYGFVHLVSFCLHASFHSLHQSHRIHLHHLHLNLHHMRLRWSLSSHFTRLFPPNQTAVPAVHYPYPSLFDCYLRFWSFAYYCHVL